MKKPINVNALSIRIAGTNIPREKRVEISLTYVYGIGRTLSNRILKEAGVTVLDRPDIIGAEIAKVLK